MDEEEILRPHYANIKALVVMSGINILEQHYLLDRLDLSAEQLDFLTKIVHDKNHPWMIEYESRKPKEIKEILRPHYANIKIAVERFGINILEEHYLLDRLDLSAEQLDLLTKIVHDKNHPWMIKYESRASSVETNSETSQIKGPRDLILRLFSFIFLFLIVVGIFIGAEWTLVDIAKFIFGLGTAVGVILLIRKLPIYFLYITILIGYAILITEYADLSILIFFPPVTFWALGDLLLSVFI